MAHLRCNHDTATLQAHRPWVLAYGHSGAAGWAGLLAALDPPAGADCRERVMVLGKGIPEGVGQSLAGWEKLAALG